MEIPKSKNVKTPSPPDRVEELTAQMIALNAFFMNEISNLKNEIERLKQTTYNQENNMNMGQVENSENSEIFFRDFQIRVFDFGCRAKPKTWK